MHVSNYKPFEDYLSLHSGGLYRWSQSQTVYRVIPGSHGGSGDQATWDVGISNEIPMTSYEAEKWNEHKEAMGGDCGMFT